MENIIGTSVTRADATDKVAGKTKYAQDIDLPGQLYMQCVFAKTPHAIIRSLVIDQAQKLEGVIAILTANDVPCNEYGVITNDQPVLCGPGSSKPFADHVLFPGDQIALVIAETEAIARQAEKLITVSYESLPIVTNPHMALLPDAPLIHPERGNNLLCENHFQLGDVEHGFRNADVIIESQYHTPLQEHAYLQPEAGIAYMQDGQIVIVSAGQWAHHDQEQIAHALKMPKEKIRVVYAAIGGAFGGKEDISVQIPLALAVKRLHEMGINRPVKTVWSRQESFIGHHKRHPFVIDAKWGADKDGRLTAAKMRFLADGGAYASSSQAVLSVAAALSTGPYYIPNVQVDAYVVYTNNIPNGAFRGFGAPQATFAAEMQINKLAQALQIDPVEMRLRNTIKEGQPSLNAQPLPPGISIDQTIAACTQQAGWEIKDGVWNLNRTTCKKSDFSSAKRIGIGFASGYKSFGIPPDTCWAAIVLHGKNSIEKAILKQGGADLGQGALSIFKQIAAQALALPIEQIQVIISDTNQAEDAGSTSASRLTFMAGNAIIGAAEKVLQNWHDGQRPAIAEYQYSPHLKNHPEEDDSDPHRAFGYGYIAEAARVEVDMRTGQVKVLDLICANDVGKALNPQQVQGQMAGAVVQALGYSLLENMIQVNAELKTDSLTTYLIPTIMDIPAHFDPIIIEHPDPLGPYGARGMAEMPFGPVAPAIAAAVHDATGVWVDRLPITPEALFTKLQSEIG
jgi:CO/xanthine dehydrogenase Mo-binding subunit